MSDETATEQITPTGLLIKAMEEFSKAEPHSAIVIFGTGAGAQIMATPNLNRAEIIGILEFAKFGVMSAPHE